MYLPKYFEIDELVPPKQWKAYQKGGEIDGRIWFMFDQRILETADRLRQRYGTLLVNTWKWGGRSQLRGYRPWNARVGSTMSQHRFGRALDIIPVQSSVLKMRQAIIAHPWELAFEHITAVELGIPWLHIDCRNYDKRAHGIFTFNQQ